MGLRDRLRRPASPRVSFDELGATQEQRRAWLESSRTGLEDVFKNHRGRILHKWTHYLDVYDSHFERYRDTPVRMLEIGVSQGGSLEMWRTYFGPDATIFGIDINPESRSCVDEPNQVRIGSQSDPDFLRAVVEEMGVPDIVLDDGSHVSSDQSISFRALFPLIADGGLYVIEDLHTAYWPDYEGGFKRSGTAVDLVKRMIDDMHHWYHGDDVSLTTDLGAIHAYDSIVVIEKRPATRPVHLHVGAAAPDDGSLPLNAALFPPRS